MIGFILSPLSLALFVLVYLIEGFVMLFVNVYKRHWLQLSNKRKFSKARKTDILGNYLFGDFFNAVLSRGGYEFGLLGETLSSVFGKKRAEESLNWFGYSVSALIDWVDFSTWEKGGHCYYSIMTEEEIRSFYETSK